MKPTPEQEAIVEAFVSSTSHCIVQALAGTGKTTTNEMGVKALAKAKPGIGVLACAFNVKIKTELEKRLEGLSTVLTMNGMGHRAWSKGLGRRVVLEKNKVGNIVNQILKGRNQPDLWAPTRALISQAKSWGIVPNKSPKPVTKLVEDSRAEWYAMADHFDIDANDKSIDLARQGLAENIRQAYEGVIDFDDQIYMPIVYGSSFERFDLVVVDEAQDLNAMQHLMVLKSAKMAGRIFAVGDKHQAIYGFRGALEDSMEQLEEQLNPTILPLTTCWRCSSAVIEHAREIVPELRASPNAKDGSVSVLGPWDEKIFQTGDAILCRNNAPLISTAFRLIAAGKGVHVIGRDIGAGLTALIQKLGSDSLKELTEDLNHWVYRESMNAKAKDDEDKLRKITDKADSIFAVIEHGGCKTVQDVLLRIDLLFSKESAPITLSSIHKSKGLEWPRVFFLDRDLICPPWLKLPWAIGQDRNLDYVGRTRAQEDLIYIESKLWKEKT